MTLDSQHQYATHPNVLVAPLEKFDLDTRVSRVTDQSFNQTLRRVNDSVVRFGALQGEWHWHKHDDDEFCRAVREVSDRPRAARR
jgi:hypothetical protein